MKQVMKVIYQFHKWFGLPLAVMFIMWYVSGIVMLYHQFPRITPSTTPVEGVDFAELRELWKEVPDSFGNCRMSFSGHKLQISTDGVLAGAYVPELSDLGAIAGSFGTGIARIDTLQDIDKWIPFDRMTVHLPIYRITGEDDSYTYVSSQTGQVLQHNTAVGRYWAWIGALPHYVYITPIRRDGELWRKVVIWMSGLSTLSVMAGLVIAIRFVVRKRTLKVFKRRSWRWHYVSGLFFGLFMLAFIFSGMMSLAKIPDWIMKSTPVEHRENKIAKADVDLNSIPARFGVLTISTSGQPMISVTTGETSACLPLNPQRPLDFRPEAMSRIIERDTGEKVSGITPVTDDIFYYNDGKAGYKASTEHFTAYWNESGYYRIMDRKSKAQAICYRFLHTMGIPGLRQIGWLHDVWMWILLLGGLAVVVTGTVLSVRTVWKRKPGS